MTERTLAGTYQEFALINDQKFSSLLPTVVPRDAVYNTVRCGPAGSRQVVEFPADNSSYTYRDNKIVIRLNSKGFLAFINGGLEFSAVASQTAGKAYFSAPIWNLFERIRVVSANNTVIDQPLKNIFRTMQWAFTRASQSDQTLGDACWGVSDVAKRIARAAGYNYYIPLDIPMFTSEEIPFANLSNGVQLELYLANPETCMNYEDPAVGAGCGYTINNLRLRCEEVFYQPDLHSEITSYPNILLPFTTFKTYQFTIPAGANNNQFVIPHRNQAMKRMLFIMRDSTSVSNAAAYDVNASRFQKNQCLEYWAKIDNTNYPQQPIKTQQLTVNEVVGQQEGYLQMVRAMARNEVYGNVSHRRNNGETHWNIVKDVQVTPDMFNNNMFVGAIDFKTFDAHDEDLLTKLDTSPGNTTLTLNMKMSNGYPLATQTLYVFCIHSAIAVLSRDGKFFLIE